MRLRLKADPDAYPLVIETDGNAGIVNGAAVYSGQFKISGADKNSAQLRGTDGETVKVSAVRPGPESGEASAPPRNGRSGRPEERREGAMAGERTGVAAAEGAARSDRSSSGSRSG